MTAKVIELMDLRFAWQPQAMVLNIPHFEVKRGERIFLAGPSGSGKSTLLGLISGVLEANAGSQKILGKELRQVTRAQRDRFRADHIGYIFQMFNLIPCLSVLENVLLTTRFSATRAAAAGRSPAAQRTTALRLLQALGLHNPEVLAKRAVTQLSQGQQQRVAAARALLGGPELLIADEPTSALDAATRLSFLALLMGECERAGTTLLFVSHDTSLGSLFDRQVTMAEINNIPAMPENLEVR
jgi:putative ABC transport system ATP-binding protein